MKFELVEHWREVAKSAWSFKLSAIGTVIAAIGMSMPYIAPTRPSLRFAISMFVMQVLGPLFTALGAASRLVKQPKLRASTGDPSKDPSKANDA